MTMTTPIRSLLVAWLLLLLGVSTADAAGVRKPYAVLRGGAGWPVRPSTSPHASTQPPPQRQPQVFEEDDEEETSQVATTEMIDSFLTRDSRNKFIGALRVLV